MPTTLKACIDGFIPAECMNKAVGDQTLVVAIADIHGRSKLFHDQHRSLAVIINIEITAELIE